MKYTVKNVTMEIDCTDGEFTGDCLVYIPYNHVKFMLDNCGMRVNSRFTPHGYEPIFECEYGLIYMDMSNRHYYSNDADILIMYLSWLLDQDGPQTVEVNYANPFWAIHDFEHAQYDESGCTVYVDKDIEYERLVDAFKLMKEEGFEITYEIVEEVTEAYNGRFGTHVSFEEYFDFEDEYYEEEEEEIEV
jgi:hypothetical protein